MVVPRKYNPGFLSDDEIVASFCVRMSEFESIVEMLRECTDGSNPHQIVIGPRGSGKTSLLLRVAAEVRRDAELSSSFFPVVFAEESYEVSTAGEFWLESLSRLAVQAPREVGAPDLNRTYDEFRTIRADQMLGDRCLSTLLDFSDREGKRLVLMVENLNTMFRDMADHDAGWRLRKILQTEPRIILLASATSRFDQIDNPDQALYDLFRVLPLRPLETQECADLWERVTGQDVWLDKIRALQILIGGSPRLFVIFARFGADLSFHKLMASLFDLVDDHTEYFKNHLDMLAAQQRRVYLALADLWKPATTKEIADRARLQTSKCSAQLARLVRQGTVQVSGGTARRKQYYLTERLYNIYYLLRRPRGPDHLVESLIRFMESYYSPPELKEIGARIAREAGSLDIQMLWLQKTALARLLELSALAEHREELIEMIPVGLLEALDVGFVPGGATKPEWTNVKPDPRQADQFQADDSDAAAEMVGKELLEEGGALRKQNRPEEALAVFDEVVRRFGASRAPALLETVAKALNNKGTTLAKLDRREEALAAFDEVAHRFGESEAPGLIATVVKALTNKGGTLGALNRLEEALAASEEVVRRFGESEILTVPRTVANALSNKVLALRNLNRSEDALAAIDEAVRRFGESEEPALFKPFANILLNKGATLGALNRPEEALVAFDEVVRRFGESEEPALLEPLAKAVANRGTTLGILNRREEALVTFDEVVRQFGGSETPALLETVARVLLNKGATLGTLNRPEEALVAFDEVVRRFGESEEPALLEPLARALANKGTTLGILNRREDALATFDEVVRQFGGSETPALLATVARVLLNKGATLGALNRPEEALVAFDEVVRRFGESEEPALFEPVAKALANKGAALVALNRPEDALAAFDEVVRQFGGSATPTLLEPVANAFVNKGAMLGVLNRPEEAMMAFDEVVNRFGERTSPPYPMMTEHALLEKAQIELECHRHEAAIRTAGRVLEQRLTEAPENRLRGHLINAQATLASGDPLGCEQDIEAILAILPKLSYMPHELLYVMMRLSIELGPERVLKVIQASPSENLLLPLTTALELELGLKPRVPREVEEVARDIREELQDLRNG